MGLWRSVIRSNFMIRLRHWEYWPFGILQFPVFFYWLWLSLRARSLFFFSGSNPGIIMGGMFGESKYEVLQKIPERYVPKTILQKIPATSTEVIQNFSAAGFTFPLIFKPDLGERGFMVKRINAEEEVESYLRYSRTHFLIQELVDLPLEFGVFYQRLPSQPKGEVISIVAKEMLTITGDGHSSFQELILKKDRAKLQWEKLALMYKDRLTEILPEGKSIELVSIGNHAQGTKFINANHLITDGLSKTFDAISKQIEGFYFGRFDLRCASIENLYSGNVKIVELNGCGAEPAHIYDPDFKLFTAIGVLLKHWKNIYRIARENEQRGFRYITFDQARHYFTKFRAATRE
jgi:hypothetical protein